MPYQTIDIGTPTLASPLPTSHDALMQCFYEHWQNLCAKVLEINRANAEKEDAEHIREPNQAEIAAVFPPKVNAAVLLGNFNYQVENGGFSQYEGNFYSESVNAVRVLFDGAQGVGIANAADVLAVIDDFIKRSAANADSSRRSHNDNDDELGFDSYGDLDERYYAIENMEQTMQQMLDRFDEVVAGSFMAHAYRKAA